MELHTIGIDLGKTVFHVVGLSLGARLRCARSFSRKQLLHFTANLRLELIGMEARRIPLSRAGTARAGSRGPAVPARL